MDKYKLIILCFWSVLGFMYFVLAIFNYRKYRKLRDFKDAGGISQNGNLVTGDTSGEDVIGLARFFRNILITDIAGFVLAALAAVLTGVTLS